ncbi:MAG: hypothetical protein GY765_05695 [bacterium]|nr:hypothetical protein [bacterium]
MKKVCITLAVLIGFLHISGFIYGAIPAKERAALIALYNSTNGDYWLDNSYWKGDMIEEDGFSQIGRELYWYGITISNDHVTEINLASNQLNGGLPAELGNLGHLEVLTLNSNQLSGSIPAELENLSSVKVLILSSNELGGSIPAELGNLGQLQDLYLNSNLLSGSIPPELGNLSNLIKLDMDSNSLSGSIPAELGNLSNLQILSLNSNRLSDEIPGELGGLGSLIELHLNANELWGGIPSGLGNLSHLTALNLASNTLSREIPQELTNLNKLSSNEGLNIAYNALYTDNTTVSAWLDSKDPDWKATQTGPATHVTISALTANIARFSWTPIDYTGDTGHYEVTLRVPSGYLYHVGRTADKSTSYYDEHMSSSSGTFSMLVTSVTNPHANNANRVAASSAWASITMPLQAPQMSVNRTVLNFAGVAGGNAPTSQSFLVSSTGALDWTAAANVSWLSVSPSSGHKAGLASVSVDASALTAGQYSGTITINNPHTEESITVTVNLEVKKSGSTSEPFGAFETPTDNATVSSSIAVTGWALDDVGVDNVQIYRQEGGDLVYIGDAVFVAGARPDVEQAYPGYPMNHRSGWGYMLLTNFLPNGGNGTFTLQAQATDNEGNTVTLGTKTITVNNADAVKPFGAIDSPTQGGEASGSAFTNQGWVLTPMPNTVPVDGSTINVYVDGVSLGHPRYNSYRPDIASLFPDYSNSGGAWARFELDTMDMADGSHNIYWTAEDDTGNTDGIGSRYFTVNNAGTSRTPQTRKAAGRTVSQIKDIPVDMFAEIKAIKGYDNANAEMVATGYDGVVRLELKEMQRVVLHLSNSMVDENQESTARRAINSFDQTLSKVWPTAVQQSVGYLQVGDQLRPLPIGSTLDAERGIFYWQPGHGFIGTYNLVFVLERENGETVRKAVTIDITATN